MPSLLIILWPWIGRVENKEPSGWPKKKTSGRVCVRVREFFWERELHGSKLAEHLSGSCKAMFLSTPEIGGPLTRVHKQGWPRAFTALQQSSLGWIGLKGATAALQGIIWMSAEKKVLPQGCAWPCSANTVNISTSTRNGRTLTPQSFTIFELGYLLD